ncbi:MAG: hypothetical protein M3198_01220 [Actinomycetota bacterium]|nr:hypothetical protein [Actinomycetota bacterium]
MDIEEIREVSKRVLGNRYRLEVAAAIAEQEPGVFHARLLADKLRLPDTKVRDELVKFTEAGLVQQLPKIRGQQDYRREDSVYWSFALELMKELRKKRSSAAMSRSQ